MKKLLVVAVVAVALSATPAMAREGFYLGADLVVNKIVGTDFDYYDPGGGLDIRVGYNFGPIAIEGNFFVSTHSSPVYVDADFSGATVDARLFFLSDPTKDDPNQFPFYMLIGYGEFDFGDVSATVRGSGYNLGFGIEPLISENVALNLAYILHVINYDEGEMGGVTYPLSPELEGNAFTFAVGLNLYF